MTISKTITNAIDKARDEFGFDIVQEEWGSRANKCCCVLGAVLIVNDEPIDVDSPTNEAKVAEILGKDPKWVACFIDGYDCRWQSLDCNTTELQEAYKLGNEIWNSVLNTS